MVAEEVSGSFGARGTCRDPSPPPPAAVVPRRRRVVRGRPARRHPRLPAAVGNGVGCRTLARMAGSASGPPASRTSLRGLRDAERSGGAPHSADQLGRERTGPGESDHVVWQPMPLLHWPPLLLAVVQPDRATGCSRVAGQNRTETEMSGAEDTRRCCGCYGRNECPDRDTCFRHRDARGGTWIPRDQAGECKDWVPRRRNGGSTDGGAWLPTHDEINDRLAEVRRKHIAEKIANNATPHVGPSGIREVKMPRFTKGKSNNG